MSAGRNGVKPPNGTRQDRSLVHVLFLLTTLISCCEAAPSWMEAVPALEPVLIPTRGIFSRQPCRWHSEPCLSKPREQSLPSLPIGSESSSWDGGDLRYRDRCDTLAAENILSVPGLFPGLCFRQGQRNQIVFFLLRQDVSSVYMLLPS